MIFISYSWKDRLVAEALCDHLDRSGVEYWIDSERLDLHRRISDQIILALINSTTLLLVESVHSVCSQWVSFERQAAAALNRRVHTIRVG
jgi:TIR domain